MDLLEASILRTKQRIRNLERQMSRDKRFDINGTTGMSKGVFLKMEKRVLDQLMHAA